MDEKLKMQYESAVVGLKATYEALKTKQHKVIEMQGINDDGMYFTMEGIEEVNAEIAKLIELLPYQSERVEELRKQLEPEQELEVEESEE